MRMAKDRVRGPGAPAPGPAVAACRVLRSPRRGDAMSHRSGEASGVRRRRGRLRVRTRTRPMFRILVAVLRIRPRVRPSMAGAMTEHDEQLDRPAGAAAREPSRPSEMSIASARVAAIVDAAERAADELRAASEDEADKRLAAAERAADDLMRAAEAEARDIADAARREAEELRMEAGADAARIRAEAEADTAEVRRSAEAEAREIVTGAHASARHVLRDGSALSEQLEQLSGSLRRNAERLLRDVQLAHETMTAELEASAPGAAEGGRGDEPAGGHDAGGEPSEPPATIRTAFDIPEFLPRSA